LSAPVAPLDYRPAHQATAELSLTPVPWLELWVGARAMSERRYVNPDNRAVEQLQAVAVVDARVEAGVGPLRGWLRVSNLFDALYSTEYGFPMPGRQVLLGVSTALEAPTHSQ
jgi:outer membrane cobalamin receptor